MSQLDPNQREPDVNEPERSFADRLASINPIIRPAVQGTVALYYAVLSQRSTYIGHP
jgi:hypothetical protein